MTRIVCGFCAAVTDDGSPCVNCRHDPVLPYTQRAQEQVKADSGHRLNEALRALGHAATIDQIAEYLDVSPRTVRRWREVAR